MARTPIIPKIQWHEGMLLSPQHFQQLELYTHQTLRYHLHSVSPFYWGIHHLKFDPVLLPSGIIRLLDIEAVMPDGLIIHQSSQPDSSLEIDMTVRKEELLKGELMIYLTVPERSQASSPVIGEWPRYASITGPEVVDENTPDNVIRIPRLIPKIELMAGTVPPARYEYLPLARVTYENEAYGLTPYLPPCFVVHKSSLLEERCFELAMKMREKASYLSEKWQTQIGTDLLNETTDLLRPLAESLPVLEATVTTGNVHPYNLYITLATIAGRLATLRLSQVIPTFPPLST